MRATWRSALFASTCGLASVWLVPARAEACGGTFCDSGPNSMPVDQTGENVLFVFGDDYVEAHIQIQYDPSTQADGFAWVVPLTAVPQFSVGSEQLFENLRSGSVPTYGFSSQRDACPDAAWPSGPHGDGGGSGGSTASTSGSGDGDGDGDGGDGDPPGPDVLFTETVGAFEIAVLSGGTVEELMQWLGDNGYQQDAAAEPILAEYLEDGFLFAAMKLAHSDGNDAIHPIVIRYAGQEPCVPLRLTRIAAQDDMEVRVFFLGETRVVPVNYRHVLVNPLEIDWLSFASNYKEVVSLAVDAEHAEGNAFVTEYAGPSDIVPQSDLYRSEWRSNAIEQLGDDPIPLMDQLQDMGLVACADGRCEWRHPLIESIVKSYLPPPLQVDESDFYGCLSCFEALINLQLWNAAAMAEDIRTRIADPGEHALDLVRDNYHLTRLYTTISPHEMLADPMFMENPKLDDVPKDRMGTWTMHCDDTATFGLPDGREVYLPNPTEWPNFPEEMPWELEVSKMTPVGAPQMLSDRSADIDAILEEWNAKRPVWTGDSGCGCAATGSTAAGLGVFALGAVLGLRRRKERS